MLTLLKFLFIPLQEYCCQLCNPWKAKAIQAIKAIQRTFTYKITYIGTALKLLGKTARTQLYSLQRRSECYIIIYIWKITQHMVPNIDGTMGHIINNWQCKVESLSVRRPQIHNTTNRQKEEKGKNSRRLYSPVPAPSNTGSARSFQRDTEKRTKVLRYCEVLQRGGP